MEGNVAKRKINPRDGGVGPNMSYIEVSNLKKDFVVKKKREKGKLLREKETVQALKGVSFEVDKGELVGYIGPNGAGKSTTVKILSGILTPDAGEVSVGGLVPWKERRAHVKNIGVVFGQRSQLWWDVPIVDSYNLLKDIYRIPTGDYESRLKELSTALQLEALMRTPLRLLSLGQRMRAELCGSLLHRPELLFLDEPTIGLDAVSKLALRDFLKWENNEYGTTIMLTTHDMEDIAALCSRVLVLGHGQKLFDGKLPDLLERFDTVRNVNVKFDVATPNLKLPEGVEWSTMEMVLTMAPVASNSAAFIYFAGGRKHQRAYIAAGEHRSSDRRHVQGA